jgi:hypothetical protein
MIVYIAGPMRGIPEDNHEAFNEAEKRWRSIGHSPRSPARMARALGKVDSFESPPNFMRQVMVIDAVVICGCDAIAVLPGWQSSKGALMEVALAKSIGIPIYDATTGKKLNVKIETHIIE